MRIILIFLPDYRSNFQGLASHSARGVGPGRGKRNNYYYNNNVTTKNKKKCISKCIIKFIYFEAFDWDYFMSIWNWDNIEISRSSSFKIYKELFNP